MSDYDLNWSALVLGVSAFLRSKEEYGILFFPHTEKYMWIEVDVDKAKRVSTDLANFLRHGIERGYIKIEMAIGTQFYRGKPGQKKITITNISLSI